MTTQKLTPRNLVAIAAATFALLAGSSIAQAGGGSPSYNARQVECDLDSANCGEVPDYCEIHPNSPKCDDTPPPWYCNRHPDECGKPVNPKPCGPNEYCRYPGDE